MKKSSLYGNWYPKKEDVLKALCLFLPELNETASMKFIPTYTR